MSALSEGKTISAVIEQCLDNCLLVRFNYRSKIFRGVLFDEKHSVVSRTSLNDQNKQAGVSSRNRSCGQPSQSRPTGNQRDDSSSQKLYRSTSSTSTRRNNASNKLQVFTEFDPEENGNTSGTNCAKDSKSSTHKIDKANTKLSLNGQRSARIKSKSKNNKKANVRSKCISNVKASKVQNESQNSKRKGKSSDNKGELIQNATWPSKDSLKLPQDVSKNAVSVQNSKAPRPKTVSPMKNEVEKTKINSHEGQLLFNINVSKTSPSQLETMNRKRKLDIPVQTADSLSKIAKKEILRDETQIVTQISKHFENKSTDENTTSSPKIKYEHTREKFESKEEVDLCTNGEEDLLIGSDKPYCFTKFYNVSTVENDISASNLYNSSDEPGSNEQDLLEMDRETHLLGKNEADVIDDRDMQTDCSDSRKSEQTDDNVSQSNSSSSTPVKRSARISERKLRQKFSDEILSLENSYLNSSVQRAKKNLSTTNNDRSKKLVKCHNSTPKKIKSDEITAGSSASRKVVMSQNKIFRPKVTKTGARIKVTPLNPKNTSSKLHTNIAPKNCRVSVGDIVWGKVHGHPWWPGRVLAVSGIINRDAHVAWFGSNTSSIMACNELAAFSANFKKRFRRNKRGAYRTAVHEAQEAARIREEKK